jgi:hypothetical protein
VIDLHDFIILEDCGWKPSASLLNLIILAKADAISQPSFFGIPASVRRRQHTPQREALKARTVDPIEFL